MNGKWRCWLLVSALWLLLHREGRAEYDPAFDMDNCVGRADLVVVGELHDDGTLVVTKAFGGDPPASAIPLGTEGLFNRLTSVEQWWTPVPFWKRVWRKIAGPLKVEVVAFVRRSGDGKWTTPGATGNVVSLSGDAVYPFDGWSYGQALPRYSRRQFFTALDEALRVKTERTRLLAAPPSLERTAALIRLALTHDPLPAAGELIEPDQVYHLSEIAHGLKKPSSEEEELFFRALKDAATESQKTHALLLASLIPLSAETFDRIAPYIDRSQPAEIRKAAIRALTRIDSFRAVDLLGPFLTRAEPELETLLRQLYPFGDISSEPVWNVAIVDRLLSLSKEFEKDVTENKGVIADFRISNQVSALRGMLEGYQHPRFVPVLVGWSAHGTLSQMTRLRFSDGDREAWPRWWESARAVLEPEYDLKTKAGRSAWIRGWAGGDSGARRLLVNLWLFEPSLDLASALLQESPEEEATKAALSELWKHHRLSPELEQSIVEKYLSFVLVEKDPPQPNQKPTYRQVAVVSKSSFEFPPTVSVQVREHVSIGKDDQPKLRDWADADETMLNSFGTSNGVAAAGEYAGAPVARGIFEMRSMDYWPDRKVRWTASFELDPIQLRYIAQ
jgi:hypothetical protein